MTKYAYTALIVIGKHNLVTQYTSTILETIEGEMTAHLMTSLVLTLSYIIHDLTTRLVFDWNVIL